MMLIIFFNLLKESKIDILTVAFKYINGKFNLGNLMNIKCLKGILKNLKNYPINQS